MTNDYHKRPLRDSTARAETRDDKSGTSMISKSQEETEVSWRLEEWALEAGVERLS